MAPASSTVEKHVPLASELITHQCMSGCDVDFCGAAEEVRQAARQDRRPHRVGPRQSEGQALIHPAQAAETVPAARDR